MASAWIHCFHKWLPKFLFSRMSSTNLYRVEFNFTTLPLCAWIEVIIRDSNNLLGFILTIGFDVEYSFLKFHCEDPFIILLNVSWRLKWFSKIFCILEFWSDTRAWRKTSCCFSLIIDPLEVCQSLFKFLQSILGIKCLQVSTSNFILMEPSSIFKLEASSINMIVSEFFVWGMNLISNESNLFIKLHTSHW